MRLRTVALSSAIGVAALGLAAAPARAQAVTETVTLDATPQTIAFGEVVTLSGSIEPASNGQAIEIRNDADATIATATTGAAGNYSVTFEPHASVVLHAVWGTATSDPVSVGVRAVVDVSLGAVRLFDRAVVRGTVRPIHTGATVELRLILGGKVVDTQTPPIGAAGGFAASFEIELPGTYRVRARFADDDLLAGTAVSGFRTTPLPSLREGSRGRYVRLLEQRLVELHYRLVAVDQTFDFRTADAVMAFRKVQRMTRTTTVDRAVWRALAHPIVPRPVLDRRAFHIEVDQSRQVLYVVDEAVVIGIIHVSTGAASTPTRDGSFSVRYKVPGYTSKRLYYASFFDGQRAIHGWPEVPSYPASHGCVRVPYWHAKWIFAISPVGTPVRVYH